MSKRILPALLVAASLAAAGCAGRGDAAQNASSNNDRETQLLKFAQCMRDHGVDIPDPKTDANGGLLIQRPRNSSGNGPPSTAERTKDRAARKACEKYLPFQQLTPAQRAQMQDNALKFAQCMRSKGFDVPDPDFSKPDVQSSTGGARRRAFFGNLNPDDPKTRTAMNACRQKAFGSKGPGGGFVTFGGGPGK